MIDNIIKAINLLENGNHKERKQCLNQMKNGKIADFGEFGISKEIYCWVIWKYTDIGENPEYKGEPLTKVVPRYIKGNENIKAILDAQSWLYW